MSLSKLWKLVMDREAWHAVIHGGQRVGHDWATELNWECQRSLLSSPVWPLAICLGPNIPGSYAILFFTALDFAFTTRHIYNRASFPLWLSCFILSVSMSNCPPLFPSSILDILWPGGLIFQCHIFFPFHTVSGVFQAIILEWFPISSSGGQHFVRTLH